MFDPFWTWLVVGGSVIGFAFLVLIWLPVWTRCVGRSGLCCPTWARGIRCSIGSGCT